MHSSAPREHVVDESPRVAVIVVNWNRREDTLGCLESLGAVIYPSYRVLVIDNGSTDGSAEAIRTAFPEIELIETGENLGFAAGNNVGLRQVLARGDDYALLLNNDTVVAPDFLDRLVSAAAESGRVGVAGPTIYYHSRPSVVWSAGGAVDWRTGQTSMLGLDEVDRGQFGVAARGVEFVTGCALLVSREALEAAGLLDERFFMYYEETEWCVRIARAGFAIRHVPAARIWHKIAPSEQGVPPLVYYYMTRNRLLFLQATNAGWRPRVGALAEYLRTFASWSLRPRWREKRAMRGVMLRALADYARGRFGRAAV